MWSSCIIYHWLFFFLKFSNSWFIIIIFSILKFQSLCRGWPHIQFSTEAGRPGPPASYDSHALCGHAATAPSASATTRICFEAAEVVFKCYSPVSYYYFCYKYLLNLNWHEAGHFYPPCNFGIGFCQLNLYQKFSNFIGGENQVNLTACQAHWC